MLLGSDVPPWQMRWARRPGITPPDTFGSLSIATPNPVHTYTIRLHSHQSRYARTTSSRVQRAAKHLIHASATCVRQHTATSQIELRTCEQSIDVLSPCALAAANASHHAHALVPAPTAAARRPICAICPKSTNSAPICDKSGGARPSLQGRSKHPSARPLSAGSDARDRLVLARAPLCCLGPNLRKTARTGSSGVEGEFEGSSIGLPSHQHRTA
jgi:hypothetical protein